MPEPKKSIMRSLGEFVGHIVHASKTDPDANRKVVSKETEERVEETPDGPVTLRRTTIEEVEYPPGTKPGAPDQSN